MKIYCASDHAGFALKNELVPYLKEKNIDVVDCGAFEFDANDDFTEWIPKAIKELESDIAQNLFDSRAIILGGSGEGEAMAANRFKGIRATVYYGGDTKILKLSKEHNDANVLSLAARFLTPGEAKAAVDIWLDATFSGEDKYGRRNASLDSLQ